MFPTFQRAASFAARALLGVWVAWSVGCAVPDMPAARTPAIPAATLDLLRPDTVRSMRVGDGIYYSYLWSSQGPWAVHLVTLDLARCDLGFDVDPAESSGEGRHRETVSVAGDWPEAVVGVNGDFFTPEGRPVGTEVSETTFRVSTARPVVAFSTEGGDPWIGVPEALDGGVRLGNHDLYRTDDDRNSVLRAIGGFPELLKDGAWVGDLEVSARMTFASVRHPRTAFGYRAGADLAWLVVVDGRQPPYSAGMSLPELTDLLSSLGATDALNLDGGGSSSMVVRGRVMNRPSDATGERGVANSLWVSDAFRCLTASGAAAR